MRDQDSPLFFGDWLKLRRKQLDLTQDELASHACCSVFALRKIEAGERRPSKQLAGMIAKALEIPLENQSMFIKIARGEQGIERLPYLVSDSEAGGKSIKIAGNLPRTLTPFIGREAELSALAQLLRDPQCSLLTIAGAGGIGKTRLAIEAVHHSRELFPDGICFVSLATINSPALIVPAIAEAAGFKFQLPAEPQAQLIHYLHTKKALLVLDNAEHLLEGAALFTEILKACTHVKMLVTSRERLNLLSEWVFEVQGLPVPPDELVKQFDSYSSISLFLQSAKRVLPGFKLREQDRQWVLKICQIMEGLPLGIELSAAWVGLLSVEEIAKEIDHNLDFLSVSIRDIPERHRSLHATLDHSWQLLSPEEKLLLSRLAVFHGSFSREAARAVCGASITSLSSLKCKSLLKRTDAGDYILHEIIRQYATNKLREDTTQYALISERHTLYFMQYLAGCEKTLQSSKQAETLDEMAKLVDNLSRGWQYMVNHCLPAPGNPPTFPQDLIHSCLFSLSFFYEERCRSLEAITLFEESREFLKTAPAHIPGLEESADYTFILGLITTYLGLHYYYIQQYNQSRMYLEGAIQLLSDNRSRVARAQAQVMLATLMDTSGQFQSSAGLVEESREIFRVDGETWWYALSTINLAFIYLSLGRLHECDALLQEGFRLVNHGDLRLEMPLLNNYANLLVLQNDFTKAAQTLQDALQLSYRLGNLRQIAYVYLYLGRVACATGDITSAEQYLCKSIEILQDFGESHDLAIVYLQLGKCYVIKPDRDAACLQFRKVLRIGQVLDKTHLLFYGLVNLANVYMIDGQSEKALEILILLSRYRIENKKAQNEFSRLQADLQAALPGEQMNAALEQVSGANSPDQARADMLAYVQAHETA